MFPGKTQTNFIGAICRFVVVNNYFEIFVAVLESDWVQDYGYILLFIAGGDKDWHKVGIGPGGRDQFWVRNKIKKRHRKPNYEKE